MRRLSRFFLLCLLLTGPAVGVATAATTAEQLVELMKAGLSDDILVALIQTDGSTFQLSAPEILSLHRQGLSERVILAMQETARRKVQERPAAPAAFETQAEPTQTFPQVVEPVAPKATPAVHVTQTVTQTVESPPPAYYPTYYPPFYSVIAVPVAIPARVHSVVTRPVTPIYWGWGGQRRPDSWNDSRLVGSPPPVIKR